jgi:prophage DNA circulation protein
MTTKSLNLGKKADFLLATGSSVATIAQLFGRNPTEWDIEEASYNNVPFHVFKSKVTWGGALPSITDHGGRRLATFKFPYKDGQTTDDLGREGETFDVDCVIFGESYVSGLKILMSQLQRPEPGILIHPVRGVVKCKMKSYELLHSHDHRKAVQLKITFIEHNFTLASYGKIANIKNLKSWINTLLGIYSALNNLINKVKGLINLVNSIKAAIEESINAYLAAFGNTIVNLNQVFNKGSSFDIPALLPVNVGGVLQADGTLSSTTFSSTVNPDDPFRSIPVSQIQKDIAAQQAIYSSETVNNVSATLAAIVVQNQINSCRVLADNLIKQLESVRFNAGQLEPAGTDSDGSLEFYAEILDIKKSVILLQEAYEQGSKQTNAGVRRYITTRLMSVREIAFANNLEPDRSIEIDILNPELESLNYIAVNSEVLVPL